MSTLYLVRHAQASFHEADYDNLAARGIVQAQRLGKAIAQRGMRFDAVYVGPLRRHVQTEAHVRAAAAEEGLDLPPAETIADVTEIDASALGAEAMARVQPSCPDLLEQIGRGALDERAREAMSNYQRVFEKLMKRWANGEFGDRMEPFTTFERRVISALQSVMKREGRKRRVMLVTSGGVVSIAARLALGVSADKCIDLMFALSNASLTELRYTESRLTLGRFNDVGYLPHDHITGI